MRIASLVAINRGIPTLCHRAVSLMALLIGLYGVAACGDDSPLIGGAAPKPGNGGQLSLAELRPSGFTLTWAEASDDSTSASELTYRVYESDQDDLNNADDVQANGTPISGSWQTGLSSLAVDSQSSDSLAYYNVLVKDRDEQISAYKAMSEFWKQNLVAYYPMAGNAVDASPGGGLDGTPIGTPDWPSDRFGSATESYHVPAGTIVDYMILPDAAFQNMGDGTVTFWIKLDVVNSSSNYFFSVADASNDNLYALSYDGDNGNIQFSHDDQSSYFPATDLEDLNWHMVTGIRDENLGTVYLDGQPIFTNVMLNANATSAGAGGVIIGQDQDTLGGTFEANQNMAGSIDDFRIFNRILSDAEIASLFLAEAP